MPAADQRAFGSSMPLESAVLGAGGGASVLQNAGDIEKSRAAWRLLVEEKLLDWNRNPGRFADDGVTPPSSQIIRLAIQLAEALAKAGIPAADSVVPDANGGVVFERRSGEAAEVYHVWDDGSIEVQRFRGANLIERRIL